MLSLFFSWVEPSLFTNEIKKQITIPVCDELLTHGRLILSIDSSLVLKYCISDKKETINWNEIHTSVLQKDTLYPKSNCMIHLYAYSKSDTKQIATQSYSFNFCKYVETAIRSKNEDVLEQMFDSGELEINLPNGVFDILRRNPIKDLYAYLVNYNYHIESIKFSDFHSDIQLNKYSKITSITLSKNEN